ncbi:hypothetical protein ACGC1H_005499 [Rhizoctonia solani]
MIDIQWNHIRAHLSTICRLSLGGVYAGILEAPDVDKFISENHWDGQSSLKVLQALRAVGKDVKEKDAEFATCFKELYFLLTAMLTDVERQAVGWDLFLFEHALCKGQLLKAF